MSVRSLLLAAASAAPVTAGITWKAVTAPMTVYYVAFGNGMFLISDGTNVTRSLDSGNTWSTPMPIDPVGGNTGFYQFSYFAGQWIAFANFGGNTLINTSPDGVTWTQRTSFSGSGVSAFPASPSLIVAMSPSSANAGGQSSPDGNVWTLFGSALVQGYNGAGLYAGGKFWAMAQQNAASSTTGTTAWANTGAMPTGNVGPWDGLAFGVGGMYVATSSATAFAASSPTGATWTTRNLAPASMIPYGGVAAGPLSFVVVGANAAGNGPAGCSSPNGTTWTNRTAAMPAIGALHWGQVAYGNGVFIAVPAGGTTIAVSTT